MLNTTADSNGFLKKRIPHIQKLTDLRMRSVYVMEIGKTLPDVSPKLETVVESLRRHLRMLYKYDEYRGKLSANTGLMKAALNLGNSEFSLYTTLVELIKDLGNINSII